MKNYLALPLMLLLLITAIVFDPGSNAKAEPDTTIELVVFDEVSPLEQPAVETPTAYDTGDEIIEAFNDHTLDSINHPDNAADTWLNYSSGDESLNTWIEPITSNALLVEYGRICVWNEIYN